MLNLILLPVLAVYGLLIGSFLNVVGLRVLKKESIAFPPSHCVNCKHRLHFHDLVPVFSYLFLRGKCRYCSIRISPLYPFGEALTAAGYVLTGYQLGAVPELAAGLLLVSVMVVISITDIREMLIPNVITFSAVVLAFALRLFIHTDPIWTYWVGAAAGSGAILLVGILGSVLMKKETVGGGDMKLYVFVGLILGWKLTLFSIFLSSLFGVVASFILFRKALANKEPIPFGPFIALGSFVSYLWGESLMNWYFNLLSF